VRLLEQKPVAKTPAQRLEGLAELVCSNSFRAEALHNAVGLLKEEMRRMGSLVIAVGDRTRVPAGGAYAVDREAFSAEITRFIDAHPKIERVVQTVDAIPEGEHVVLATGPLTGDALAADLARVLGNEHLAYYDAIAPVVLAESIDWGRVFRASRYDKGGDDAYVNCPLDEAEYEAFITAVLEAEKVETRDFEEPRYFEGCLPIEVLAERGRQTLSFGCMKPVGLVDPRTGKRPHAVVQLRQENAEATAYNLVGFQTRMKWPEQKRIFRMIPGLENAEFERLGSVHRNTFVNSPKVLRADLALAAMPRVRLAGQITGVEGYVESAACGLALGITLASAITRGEERLPPRETALGSLLAHLSRTEGDFQPSNVVFSMFPPIEGKFRGKRPRRDAMVERALVSIDAFASEAGVESVLGALRGRFAA
jgi:methylenetetrahydrofolate--tRNA-(uracil-5-)-methyltransferase